MQMRAKALTVATAMVTTFAILPTLGAAAAEPLQDGSYDVEIDGQTYTVVVDEGTPVIEEIEGIEFLFDFDDDGRVLDEFDVTVDGAEYDVEVGDDGTATVTEDVDGDDATGTDDTSSTDGTTDTVEGDGTTDVVEGEEATDEEATDEEATDEEVESTEEEAEDEEEVEAAEESEEDDAHGELVSSVAECAPSGRTAREAGLPNHGFFVSAAARGESVEFEVDGEVLTADLSTQEGADEFCTLATELLEGDDEPVTEDGEDTADSTEDTDATTEDSTDETEEVEAAEDEDDDAEDEDDAEEADDEDGRPEAPGRSGDAPGQAKRGN